MAQSSATFWTAEVAIRILINRQLTGIWDALRLRFTLARFDGAHSSDPRGELLRLRPVEFDEPNDMQRPFYVEHRSDVFPVTVWSVSTPDYDGLPIALTIDILHSQMRPRDAARSARTVALLGIFHAVDDSASWSGFTGLSSRASPTQEWIHHHRRAIAHIDYRVGSVLQRWC